MEVVQFEATLCFKKEPKFSVPALVDAWAREGYTCEAGESDGVFAGWRGANYVVLGSPESTPGEEVAPDLAESIAAGIDFDATHMVNPVRGAECLRESQFGCELVFRTARDADQPLIAHNEWVGTLLGIHQVEPIHALVFHTLDMVVGREDLDEMLDYANSHLDAPPQFCPQLAFGMHMAREGAGLTVWTTGLDHFHHGNLIAESNTLGDLELARVVFNAANWVVQAGRTLAVGETMDTAGHFCRLEADTLDGMPAVRLVVRP